MECVYYSSFRVISLIVEMWIDIIDTFFCLRSFICKVLLVR